MTNTETRKSAKELRAEWIGEFTGPLSLQTSALELLRMATRILEEGPEMARSDFERWQRPLRFMELQLTSASGSVPLRRLVAETLLKLINADRFNN